MTDLSLRLVFRYGLRREEQVHQKPPTGALDRDTHSLEARVSRALDLPWSNLLARSLGWPDPFTFAAGLRLAAHPPHGQARLDYDFVGLHRDHLREDFRLVGWLCVLTFVPYAIGHHFYMTKPGC